MERPSFSKKIEIKEEEEEEEAKIKERQSLKRTKQKAKVRNKRSKGETWLGKKLERICECLCQNFHMYFSP